MARYDGSAPPASDSLRTACLGTRPPSQTRRRPEGSCYAGPVATKRRGLEDVLHYFIPEDEQREAREKVRETEDAQPVRKSGEAAPAHAPTRWCVPIDPRRPLACGLAVDLGVALRREGAVVEIAAPFPPAFVRPGADLPWRTLRQDFDTADLEASPGVLLLLPPTEVAACVSRLDPRALDGVLLPIESTPQGLRDALSILRALPAEGLRICVVVVVGQEGEGDESLARLKGAARRQLGLEIESLGILQRDRESFRSLLFGVSVLELDAEAGSARSLRALGERLAASPPRPGLA